jgi:oligopeptide transport system ATP-binding protein
VSETVTPAALEIRNLKTHFPIERGFLFKHRVGTVKAVDGVSLTLRKGEILGLVGESGCGKSTLGRSILQLIRPTEGAVLLEGENLTELRGAKLRRARAAFQMVFQDPYASLNPRLAVFDTLAEAVQAHRTVGRVELKSRVSELLKKVGLTQRALHRYPHEFSGGQRQRIAIARALAVEPKLIIADEPVSALDVSIQAQIINLLAQLSREMGLTLIFISHDLSVVRHISERIAVMYLGKIVELGPANDIFFHPLHPYTKALLSAIPIPDPRREGQRQRVLLPGDLPSPLRPPPGCPFHPRCLYAEQRCQETIPSLDTFRDASREVSCLRANEIN